MLQGFEPSRPQPRLQRVLRRRRKCVLRFLSLSLSLSLSFSYLGSYARRLRVLRLSFQSDNLVARQENSLGIKSVLPKTKKPNRIDLRRYDGLVFIVCQVRLVHLSIWKSIFVKEENCVRRVNDIEYVRAVSLSPLVPFISYSTFRKVKRDSF